MNEQTIAALKRYEALKMQAKEIDAELEMLVPIILPELPEDSKIETDNGTFTLSSRVKWTYSESVNDMEETLKKRKKEEEQTGVATEQRGTPFIVYKQKRA